MFFKDSCHGSFPHFDRELSNWQFWWRIICCVFEKWVSEKVFVRFWHSLYLPYFRIFGIIECFVISVSPTLDSLGGGDTSTNDLFKHAQRHATFPYNVTWVKWPINNATVKEKVDTLEMGRKNVWFLSFNKETEL